MARRPLSVTHRKLCREWDAEKNHPATPKDFTAGSNHKAHWICAVKPSHRWPATIGSRVRGAGCPFCSGKQVDPDVSLAVTHPALARQWDTRKNHPLTPYDVTHGSPREVHWRCPAKHHSYPARIDNRVYGGTGCPVCANRKVTKDNSLATTHPAIAAQWHPTLNSTLTPRDVTAGSHRRVIWRCERGHDFPSMPYQRTGKRMAGCQFCSGHAVSPERSLAVAAPDVAAQWHPTRNGDVLPSDVTVGSDFKAWWLCKFNHAWPAPVGNRVRLGSGCPKCTKQTSRAEVRIVCELQLIFPDVEHRVRVANGIECDVLVPLLNTVIEFDGRRYHACKLERDTTKTAKLRQLGLRVIRLRDASLANVPGSETLRVDERNELRKTDIDALLAKLSEAGLPARQRKAIARYRAQRDFQATEAYADMLKALPGPPKGRSLAEVAPHLVKEWDRERNGSLKPQDMYAGSSFRAHWRCRHGHRFPSSVSGRVRGRRCPYCARRGSRYCAPEHSLQHLFPEVAAEFDFDLNVGLTPLDIQAGSNKSCHWVCSRNPLHKWPAVVRSRTHDGCGCPYCAGKKVLPQDSLAARYPAVARQWDPERNGDLTPQEVTPHSSLRAWWRCTINEAHRWPASVNNRTRRKSGCPECVGKRPRPA